jgi:hypothetical protein
MIKYFIFQTRHKIHNFRLIFIFINIILGFFLGIITVPGLFLGIVTTPLICLGIITVLILGIIQATQ